MKIPTTPSLVRRALDYTEVRPSTDCNFEEPQILQAASSAAVEGFYMLGPSGAVTNSAAAAVGLTAQKQFGKPVGVLAGAATGAALAAAAGQLFGGSAAVPLAVMGGLCGAYSTMRGNQESKFRDAGAFGLSFAVPFSGGAKAGVAIGSLLAAEFDHEGTRALAGAALGSAAGLACALTGHSALGPGLSALAGGVAATLGSVAGPRLGQAMRNLTEDMGEKMTKKKEESGEAPSEETAEKSLFQRTAGVVPMALARQGAMSLIMGKANFMSWVTGAGIDAGLSAYEIFLTKRKEDAEKQQDR